MVLSKVTGATPPTHFSMKLLMALNASTDERKRERIMAAETFRWRGGGEKGRKGEGERETERKTERQKVCVSVSRSVCQSVSLWLDMHTLFLSL